MFQSVKIMMILRVLWPSLKQQSMIKLVASWSAPQITMFSGSYKKCLFVKTSCRGLTSLKDTYLRLRMIRNKLLLTIKTFFTKITKKWSKLEMQTNGLMNFTNSSITMKIQKKDNRKDCSMKITRSLWWILEFDACKKRWTKWKNNCNLYLDNNNRQDLLKILEMEKLNGHLHRIQKWVLFKLQVDEKLSLFYEESYFRNK